jgi:hypothetical protein
MRATPRSLLGGAQLETRGVALRHKSLDASRKIIGPNENIKVGALPKRNISIECLGKGRSLEWNNGDVLAC